MSKVTIANLREYRGWQITASWTTEQGLSIQLWNGSGYGKTITNRYQESVLRQIDRIEDILDSTVFLVGKRLLHEAKNKPADLQSA